MKIWADVIILPETPALQGIWKKTPRGFRGVAQTRPETPLEAHLVDAPSRGAGRVCVPDPPLKPRFAPERLKSALVANYPHSLGSEVRNAGTLQHVEVLPSLFSGPPLSLRARARIPSRVPPQGCGATVSRRPGAPGCRAPSPTWDKRPEPASAPAERPRGGLAS